jgi:hypothetical protein
MKLMIAGRNLLAFTEPKPPLQVIIVTGRNACNLAGLIDDYIEAGMKNRGRQEKIRFWMEVAKLYPETEKGYWGAKTDDRLSVTLIRSA